MAFLELALDWARVGGYVFPCKPRSKQPLGTLVPHGWKDATNDEAQIRDWWGRVPDANVAIACNPSNLCVVDIDHGLTDDAALREFLLRNNIPATFTVRTGRRPEFGAQLYFVGAIPDVGEWKYDGCSGQVKSLGGYVMAAGSIHPDSGEPYVVIDFVDPVETPDWARNLRTNDREKIKDDGEPITENRNVRLTSIAGKLRNAGLSREALEVALLQVNADRCQPPLDDEEVKRIAANASNWKLPEADPIPVLGNKQHGGNNAGEQPVKTDWRERYMSVDAFENVAPPEFLIDDFLVKKSIAMLAGPVAQRKSIIALNIAHALCTGEQLFGYFHVTGGHERVVYLCPEMGAPSFVKRIKEIGLGGYVGKTLFIQTMSQNPTPLDDLEGELPGAVVIVDTITRFVEGSENDSKDMRIFAQKVFRLANAGATVVLLHHSKKGSSGSLDDGLRGSSELAAFVDSCWVTELEDPKKPYESLSKMRNVKQRDFESDPFRLKPAPGSYCLTMDGDPAPEAVIRSKKEEVAREALAAILKETPKMGINKLRDVLKARGHGKGNRWITITRGEILGTGSVLSSE